MKARAPVVIAMCVVLLASACGTASPPRARVDRSGFAVRGEHLGTGAVVRVDGDRALKEIALRVSFFAGGDRLGAERDTLPFCPPTRDCPWGQLLFGERLGPNWRSVDRVEVEIVGDGGTGSTPGIESLETRSGRTTTSVTRNGTQGTAYLLAFRGDRPVLGYSFFAQADVRDPLRYSQQLFPRRSGDRVRAFLYPGAIPRSVGGTTD
jgi:hypothetical protein